MSRVIFLSPSKLESYDRCPKAFKNTRFEGNEATFFGDAVHKAVEAFLLGRSDFMPVFMDHAAKSGLPALSQEIRDRAKACFSALVGSSKLEINPDSILTVESSGLPAEMTVTYDFPEGSKTFFQVPVASEWGLRGSMDFADVLDDGTLRIVDWKTGLSSMEDEIQLACYALAAWKIFPGFAKIQTGFFHLEQGGKYEYSTWDERSLVGAFRVIEKTVKRFNTDKTFLPKLNKWCGYCQIRSDCGLYLSALKKAPAVPEWTFEASRENLPVIMEKHREISAIKKIVDGIEKNLNEARKTVLKEHGPQVVGDNEVFLSEYPSCYDYDLPALFSKVEEITGLPPFRIMKLDSAAYDELVSEQEDEAVKKALRAVKKDCGTVKSHAVKIGERICKNPESLVQEAEKPAPAEPAPDPEAQAVQPSVPVPVPAKEPAKSLYVCTACGIINARTSKPESCLACHADASGLLPVRDDAHAQKVGRETMEKIRARRESARIAGETAGK